MYASLLNAAQCDAPVADSPRRKIRVSAGPGAALSSSVDNRDAREEGNSAGVRRVYVSVDGTHYDTKEACMEYALRVVRGQRSWRVYYRFSALRAIWLELDAAADGWGEDVSVRVNDIEFPTRFVLSPSTDPDIVRERARGIEAAFCAVLARSQEAPTGAPAVKKALAILSRALSRDHAREEWKALRPTTASAASSIANDDNPAPRAGLSSKGRARRAVLGDATNL